MKFIKLKDSMFDNNNARHWASFFSEGQKIAEKMMQLKLASEWDFKWNLLY